MGCCIGARLIVDNLRYRLTARRAAPAEMPYLRRERLNWGWKGIEFWLGVFPPCATRGDVSSLSGVTSGLLISGYE